MRDAATVGITAGASAPEVMIEHVPVAPRDLAPVALSTMDGLRETAAFPLPPGLE